MTLQQLFGFNEQDLQANRFGRLSPAQQTRWQKWLKSSRGAQRAGIWILVLVFGAMILAGAKYVRVFLPDIPREIFPWITGIGILMVAFPILLAIKARRSANKKMQRTKAEVGRGQVTRLEGPLQLIRTFDFGGQTTYYTGYITTLSVNGQALQWTNEKIGGREDEGQALFDTFGLTMPPEQKFVEDLKRIPQVTEVPHGTYRVYCLQDAWDQLHILSLELVRQ